LRDKVPEYPWASALSMTSMLVIFIAEVLMKYFVNRRARQNNGTTPKPEQTEYWNGNQASFSHLTSGGDLPEDINSSAEDVAQNEKQIRVPDVETDKKAERYASQIAGVAVFEFGVIFHNILVGLTVAVAGKEFKLLYGVLTFHTLVEGLALGSRLADTHWPNSKAWTSYVLAVVFALSTPVAIGIGLGVRSTYDPNSMVALMANGVLGSISAGILIYTGFLQLLAKDFLYDNSWEEAGPLDIFAALGATCTGAFVMALLGYWT
jgi:solute carrier family 39 (zinc transporter), member 1/2/3